MKRRLYTLDVFTTKPFAGNPLAVVTDGDGIPTAKMQAIAREMNLSETVFIQRPTNNRALARLRIFTTTRELPFAGHPVIGTWFLLADSSRAQLPRWAAEARDHDAKGRAIFSQARESRRTGRCARVEARRF